MNIGIDIDGVLTDLERETIDFGTKMCIEENWPITIDLSKYWEVEAFGWTSEQADKFWNKYLVEYVTQSPARRFAKEIISKLREEGNTIYSISRLNTVDECGWEYWQTYVEHLKGKDNIYGFTGTRIHKCLGNIQNGIKVDFPKEVNKMLDEAKFLDIKFYH